MISVESTDKWKPGSWPPKPSPDIFFEEKRLKNALGRRRFPFPVFAVRISSTYNIESNETFTDETINDDDGNNSDHDEFVTVKFLLNKPKKSYLPDSVQRKILFILLKVNFCSTVYLFICLSVKYFLSVERKTQSFKMKLLESSRFEVINSALFVQTGDSRIVGR